MENKFKEYGMSDKEWNTRVASLTKKQLLYFQIMIPKAGVLYIQSKPGIAKSATARAIATKMGMQYMDIRLSMVDETDVGLYPSVGEVNMTIDGRDAMVKVLSHVVPEWAVKANQAPTVIHFEELNRASLHVRNAALQLLLEREIGINFKFNENVLMLSSGNLGEEDGTDVEEFDNALNNRLIAFQHSLSFQEWSEDFAKFHVCPQIVSFLHANPEKLYVNPTENCLSYATPRSWTFLSQFIFENYGTYVLDADGENILDEQGNKKKSYGDVKNWLGTVSQVGRSYLGDTITKFIRYCEENINVSIWDILDRYKELEGEIKEFNRDRKSELLINLKDLDLEELTPKQIDNAAKFLKLIDADERTGYLLHMLDNKDISKPQTKRLLIVFKKELEKIRMQNKQQD